jgi:putative Mg2+ transporter-C (MgtC) family protein
MLHDLSISVIGRLLLATLLGGAIGLERELRHKPAGLRTNMLICFGSALFSIISYEMAGTFGGDHTRIAAQIIPGIGFIGAGVVMRERGAIMGITSAATIFVVASIGMAAGGGMPVTAIFATVLCVVALALFGVMENHLGFHSRALAFRIVTPQGQDIAAKAHRIVEDAGIEPHRWQSRSLGGETSVEFEAEVTVSQERDLLTRFADLKAHIDVRKFQP